MERLVLWGHKYLKKGSNSPSFRASFVLQDGFCKLESQPFATQAEHLLKRDDFCEDLFVLEKEISSLEQFPRLPSSETLINILQRCRKEKDSNLAVRLHKYMIEKHLDGHNALGNYLVAMLADCGCMQEARKVLDSLEVKKSYSYNALISQCITCGDIEHVFVLHRKMQGVGVRPTSYTYVALIKACSMLKDLDKGRQLRNEITNKGLLKDPFVSNAFVNMFGKCGSLIEAREVFDNLLACDVVSWSSLMAAYADHGEYKKALDCFVQMQSQGVTPNVVSYICGLKSCAIIGERDLGREIYFGAVNKGFDTDLYIGNTAVDMFCKCNCLQEAQLVFDNLCMKDVVSWNALMAGYVENGLGKQALTLFQMMSLRSLLPDDVSFVCSLKACATAEDLKTGQGVHGDIVKRGLESDISVGNALVDMLGKCGALEDAQLVFDKLPSRDAVSWGALQMGYAQHGCDEEALECFHQMQKVRLSPDPIILGCSLKVCGSLGATEKGHKIHGQVIMFGFENDVQIGGVLVDMYGELGLLLSAHKVFDRLPEQNLTSWTALIKGYGINHEGKKAIQCFQNMQKEGIKPDPIAFTSLLVACSLNNLVDEGQEYFHIMEEEAKTQNLTDYHLSCIVDLLARAGRVREALRILKTSHCRPSKEMCKALLSASRSYGELEVGLRCLSHLVEWNADDASAYAMVVEIYINVERFEEAEKLDTWRKHKWSSKEGPCKLSPRDRHNGQTLVWKRREMVV